MGYGKVFRSVWTFLWDRNEKHPLMMDSHHWFMRVKCLSLPAVRSVSRWVLHRPRALPSRWIIWRSSCSVQLRGESRSSVASHGIRREWTAASTPLTSCTWREKTARRWRSERRHVRTLLLTFNPFSCSISLSFIRCFYWLDARGKRARHRTIWSL